MGMNTRLWRLPAIGSVIAVPLLFSIDDAFAQDQIAQATTQQPGGRAAESEVVIVTANKRSEDVKDVPTSISVLSGAALEDQHVVSYEDVSRSVPGLSFGGGTGGEGVGDTNLEIRGISSGVGAATVGLYLDETPITLSNQSGTSQPQMFDIDRIEVLRGPQGTLYGASSEGGTLRFITKQPDLDEFHADVSSDLSGTEHGSANYDEKAVINIPILPGVFAIRGGVEYGDQSGWINQYAHAGGAFLASDPVDAFTTSSGKLLQSGTNDVRTEVFKLAATYQDGSDLKITPSIYYQRQKQSDSPDFFLNEGLYTETRATADFGRDTMIVPSVTVDKNLGFADLTSVTSYFWRQFNRSRDGTYYDPDVIVPYYLDTAGIFTPQQTAEANSELATLPTTSQDRETNRVTTEELRLTSRPGDANGLPFKWVAGLFFSNDTDILNHYEDAPGWNNTFESIYGFNPNSPLTPSGQVNPVSDPTDPTLWNGDKIYYDISKRGVAQYAAFGQADFDIMPTLHASAGIRYQYSDLTYSRVGGGWWDIGDLHNYSASARNYALTPKFSLNYDLTSTTNVYATAAKGYRVGGDNDPVPPGLCGPYYHQLGISSEPPTYGPDKLWSYELGTKSRMLDNSLSIDADVYHIEWQNVQQQITLPVCGFDYISNVGDAESNGFELELHYRVRDVPGLVIGGSGGIQHAVVTSSINPGAAAVGEHLLFTPSWTAAFNASYNWSVTDEMNAFVRTDYDWTGNSHGDFLNTAVDYSDPQYGVLNGTLGVEFGGYEISIYGKNLTENTKVIKHPEIALVTEAYTLQPLTIGLLVQKHW